MNLLTSVHTVMKMQNSHCILTCYLGMPICLGQKTLVSPKQKQFTEKGEDIGLKIHPLGVNCLTVSKIAKLGKKL